MDLSYKISSCFRKKNMKERHTTIMQSTIFQTITTRKPVHENDMIGFFFGKKRKLSLTGSPSRSGFGAWHLTHAPPDSRVCLRMRDQSISCHVPRVKKNTVCYWKWPINSWFTYKKLWFSIIVLNYQRVIVSDKWCHNIPQQDSWFLAEAGKSPIQFRDFRSELNLHLVQGSLIATFDDTGGY